MFTAKDLTPESDLFRWDHDHCNKVDQNTWHAAWNECNKKGKAEPEGTNSEKFSQPTTNASNHAVTF